MKFTLNEIYEIIAKMNILKSTDNIAVTSFKSLEDGSDYNVWHIEANNERYVLKNAKNYEFEIYSTFFKDNILGVPNLITSTEYGNEKFILMEYIEGEDLCKCVRSSLKLALDALIGMQDKYWNNTTHENIGYTYQSSLESRINRGKYLGDEELEKAYQEFLSVYSKIPRTLCHDDLLPFNVIVNEKSASLIDWEYAGILPYPTSIARLLAHTEENENALFYMTNEDKEFAKKYYYDNLVAKHNVPYKEYEYTLDLFLLYEYCEWIMLANRYPNSNKERGNQYIEKAKKHFENMKKG